MQPLLVVIELFVSVALIVVILLQRSEGGALGMGGGGSGLGGLFSPRGASDTLTRTTAILAVVFFLTCLGLNLVALRGRDETSILDTNAPTQTAPAAPAAPKDQAPAVPAPHP
jgi:preprotein translocase subunit SecG